MSENKPKEFVVYRICHIDTGKSYIGITGDYKKRMKEHFRSKDNYYLHKAIRKYGREKFITEIVFECDSFEKAKKEEKEYISIFNTKIPNGYNMTDGGEGVLGFKHTDESNKKNSIAHIGKLHTEKAKRKISKASSGRLHTEGAKRKISKIAQNRKYSNETRKKMSESAKGKKYSNETRKKMSEAGRFFLKDQILEIRKMLLNKIPQRKIAQRFNVAHTTIGCINRNKTYADIQLPEKE